MYSVHFLYSKTCLERPPNLQRKTGRYREVVVLGGLYKHERKGEWEKGLYRTMVVLWGVVIGRFCCIFRPSSLNSCPNPCIHRNTLAPHSWGGCPKPRSLVNILGASSSLMYTLGGYLINFAVYGVSRAKHSMLFAFHFLFGAAAPNLAV